MFFLGRQAQGKGNRIALVHSARRTYMRTTAREVATVVGHGPLPSSPCEYLDSLPPPGDGQRLEELKWVVTSLEGRFPRVAMLLQGAAADVVAYMMFPVEHWQEIHSTDPLERLMREVGRRADVVGIFPNPAAAVWLIGAVLHEQQDEWQVSRRYLSNVKGPSGRSAVAPGNRQELRP